MSVYDNIFVAPSSGEIDLEMAHDRAIGVALKSKLHSFNSYFDRAIQVGHYSLRIEETHIGYEVIGLAYYMSMGFLNATVYALKALSINMKANMAYQILIFSNTGNNKLKELIYRCQDSVMNNPKSSITYSKFLNNLLLLVSNKYVDRLIRSLV